MEGVNSDSTADARVALLLIDLQNAYFESPELAEVKGGLIERANELVRVARQHDRPVVLVRTVHARDKSTWTVNMLEDDEGFAFPGTAQAAFVDGLDTDAAVDVTKTRDDAFHATGLHTELRELGVGHVLIGGVSTHSCITATAMAAFARDLHASIAGEVIASEKPALADAMLEFLTDEMRQPVLDQERSITFLRHGPHRRD